MYVSHWTAPLSDQASTKEDEDQVTDGGMARPFRALLVVCLGALALIVLCEALSPGGPWPVLR